MTRARDSLPLPGHPSKPFISSFVINPSLLAILAIFAFHILVCLAEGSADAI
jgi:hypothetical protein